MSAEPWCLCGGESERMCGLSLLARRDRVASNRIRQGSRRYCHPCNRAARRRRAHARTRPCTRSGSDEGVTPNAPTSSRADVGRTAWTLALVPSRPELRAGVDARFCRSSERLAPVVSPTAHRCPRRQFSTHGSIKASPGTSGGRAGRGGTRPIRCGSGCGGRLPQTSVARGRARRRSRGSGPRAGRPRPRPALASSVAAWAEGDGADPAGVTLSGRPSARRVGTSQSRTVWSAPVDARVWPSGLKVTRVDDVRVAGERRPERRRASTSQSHTAPSRPALASMSPSGAKATALTNPAGPAAAGRAAGGLPMSHSRTVPSCPAAASVSPSGRNATPLTAPRVGVERRPDRRRPSTSHSRTVSSSPPVASVSPSALNATALTVPV